MKRGAVAINRAFENAVVWLNPTVLSGM